MTRCAVCLDCVLSRSTLAFHAMPTGFASLAAPVAFGRALCGIVTFLMMSCSVFDRSLGLIGCADTACLLGRDSRQLTFSPPSASAGTRAPPLAANSRSATSPICAATCSRTRGSMRQVLVRERALWLSRCPFVPSARLGCACLLLLPP
jgi:hypothetical protein